MKERAFFVETEPPYVVDVDGEKFKEDHVWGTSTEQVINKLSREGFTVTHIDDTASWTDDSSCGMPDHPPEGGY
jgi:hypothetical protein